jgi:hypothetical protein
MACKIARSQHLRLLPLGISQGKVYKNKPRTTVDLEQNIGDEAAAISPTIQQRVKQNFQKRFLECVDKPNRHYIQEMNIVIKIKLILVINSCKRVVFHFILT